MKLFYDEDNITLYQGNVEEVLYEMPAQSIQCVVTSPPYYALRDYGTATWVGGEDDCDHVERRIRIGEGMAALGEKYRGGGHKAGQIDEIQYRAICGKCGAKRIDAQIGLEESLPAYIERMVGVFRGLWHVLRDDGTVWLNIGDTYAGGGNYNGNTEESLSPKQKSNRGSQGDLAIGRDGVVLSRNPGLGIKNKELMGVPWRLALALQQPYYTGKIRSEVDRVWLAAMVEAEGCLFIHKRKVGQSNGQGYVRKNDSYGAGLEVSSTDKAIVERCLQIAGIGSICEQTPEQNERRKQTIYRWNARTNACRDVIRELYPHLVAKQHEARLLIGCPSNGEDAAKAHESLKALHQGEPATIDFPAPKSLYEPGWYLRRDVIWSKPNSMPESCRDRPSTAHEYLFQFTKRPHYFFDQLAVKEPHSPDGRQKTTISGSNPGVTAHENYAAREGKDRWPEGGRNIRSVWTIPTQPMPEAHFATFPEKLVEPCIKASTSEKGCCPQCGIPWVRVTDGGSGGSFHDHSDDLAVGQRQSDGLRGDNFYESYEPPKTIGWQPGCDCVAVPEELVANCVALSTSEAGACADCGAPWRRVTETSYENPGNRTTNGPRSKERKHETSGFNQRLEKVVRTLGWEPTCECLPVPTPIPCSVLDPFVGSGTVPLVARRLGRRGVGIDLSPDYLKIAEKRVSQWYKKPSRTRQKETQGQESLFG